MSKLKYIYNIFSINILYYRFINLSEEKINMEKDLKNKLNSTNNTIYILTNELENLQKEIEEKNINNNKLFEECQNLSYLIENKTENIKALKEEKKKLEKNNTELKLQNEKNMKEIEYLINQNKMLKNNNNINQLQIDEEKINTI